jgi:hypothetical protein
VSDRWAGGAEDAARISCTGFCGKDHAVGLTTDPAATNAATQAGNYSGNALKSLEASIGIEPIFTDLQSGA